MDAIEDADGLVELPKYASAATYEATARPAPARRVKGWTLLDRLVSTAGVDSVTIDLVALEDDLARLRVD